MQIFSASSCNVDEATAVAEIKQQLLAHTDKAPNFLQILFASALDANKLQQAFADNFPTSKFSAVTSHLGTFDANNLMGHADSLDAKQRKVRFSVKRMAEKNREEFSGVFVMAFYDARGSFGNIAVDVEDDLERELIATMQDVAKNAGRSGVIPDLIMTFSTNFDIALSERCIKESFGSYISVIGGVIGYHDNAKIFTQDRVVTGDNIFLVNYLYLHCEVQVESLNTCEYTGLHGKVTRCSGNDIEEINNQPAGDYILMCNSINSADMNVVEMNQAFNPIMFNTFSAKASNNDKGKLAFTVSMINSITPNRGINTNANWEVNEEFFVMKNSNMELHRCFYPQVDRPGRKLLAQFHVMCISFNQGKSAMSFKEMIVDNVRHHHQDIAFTVFSAGGEIGKDIQDRLTLANYTVATVSFFTHMEQADEE